MSYYKSRGTHMQFTQSRAKVWAYCADAYMDANDTITTKLKAYRKLEYKEAKIYLGIDNIRNEVERVRQLATLIEDQAKLKALEEDNKRRDDKANHEMSQIIVKRDVINKRYHSLFDCGTQDQSMLSVFNAAVYTINELSEEMQRQESTWGTREQAEMAWKMELYAHLAAVTNRIIEFLDLEGASRMLPALPDTDLNFGELKTLVDSILDGLQDRERNEQKLVNGVKNLTLAKQTMKNEWASHREAFENLRDSEGTLRAQLTEKVAQVEKLYERVKKYEESSQTSVKDLIKRFARR